jgi:membrane dipeptidase
MNRREFHSSLLKTSAAAILAPRLFAEESSAVDAKLGYRKAIVIDSLCDPFIDLGKMPSPEEVAAIRDSGITAVNSTISLPDLDGTLRNLGIVAAMAEKYPGDFLFVRKHSDITAAKRDNKIGVMPGFQHTTFFENDLDRLEMFRNLGVRIVQITYNTRNAFGDGSWSRAMRG